MKVTKILTVFLILCLMLSIFIGCDVSELSLQDNMTIGQKNALKTAGSYLKYSGFSRQRLIDQLEYEGFEQDDIIFAVDNVKVDWNEECYETAKSYLRYSSFSKQGLIDQLEYEGFTDDQIAYAIEMVGYGTIQGNEGNQQGSEKEPESTMTIGQKNALKTAESYLKYSGFSRQRLIDQLEYEGFEQDDIIFAVDNVKVDWNEECYETAKSYLRYSSFSKQGLIDQLEYEGFTDDQIAYAIQKVGY